MVQVGKQPQSTRSGRDADGLGGTVQHRGIRVPPLRIVETPPRRPVDLPALTRREFECIGWCADGKSYWETAVILGISERTVSFHMEAVRGKLKAATNAHAVAMAMRLGLLEAAPRQGLP